MSTWQFYTMGFVTQTFSRLRMDMVCLLPICFRLSPGHEIVGRALRVGKNAQNKFKIGDIIGLGPLCYACGECEQCKNGDDNACAQNKMTYTFKFTDEANTTPVQHYGGFAAGLRTHHSFLVKIPGGIPLQYVGPLLCAGVTVFAPMNQHNIKNGSVVGIIGIGGLGHLAIQFAHKLGAHVIAFSRSDSKKDFALKLGADEYVNTSQKNAVDKYMRKLDMLLVTGAGDSFSIEDHAPLCKPKYGRLHIVAAIGKPMEVQAMTLIMTQISISGSAAGSTGDAEKMLIFAAENDIKPIIETFPHTRANEALGKVRDGSIRFRAVLENDLLTVN